MKKMKLMLILIGIPMLLTHCTREDNFFTTTETSSANASILGSARYYTKPDGTGNEPIINAIVFYGDSLLITGDTTDVHPDVVWTMTDEMGNYEFNSLPPSQDMALIIFPDPFTYILTGFDATPDGDQNETELSKRIDIALEENEVDDGNNFIGKKLEGKISGNVLEDTDGDGFGDAPMADVIIDLLPLTEPEPIPILDSVSSDINGYYEFSSKSPGEYLLRIRENGFNSVQAVDNTPDPDGTNSINSTLISVVLETDEHDADNDFLVVEDNCTEDLVIAPNCPNPCELGIFPIACFYEPFTGQIVQAGPGTSLEWYNHTTNQSHTSDVIYVSISDSISLLVTLPDSCVYELTYKEDC